MCCIRYHTLVRCTSPTLRRSLPWRYEPTYKFFIGHHIFKITPVMEVTITPKLLLHEKISHNKLVYLAEHSTLMNQQSFGYVKPYDIYMFL